MSRPKISPHQSVDGGSRQSSAFSHQSDAVYRGGEEAYDEEVERPELTWERALCEGVIAGDKPPAMAGSLTTDR